MRVLMPQDINTHFFLLCFNCLFFKPNVGRTGHRDQINSPTPIPSPLESGVNIPVSCWRTVPSREPVLLR